MIINLLIIDSSFHFLGSSSAETILETASTSLTPDLNANRLTMTTTSTTTAKTTTGTTVAATTATTDLSPPKDTKSSISEFKTDTTGHIQTLKTLDKSETSTTATTTQKPIPNNNTISKDTPSQTTIVASHSRPRKMLLTTTLFCIQHIFSMLCMLIGKLV